MTRSDARKIEFAPIIDRYSIKFYRLNMRRYLALSVALILTISGCSEKATEWREIGYSPTSHFYVSGVIEAGAVNGQFGGITTLWDFNQPQTLPDGIRYQSAVFKLLVDCNRKLAAEFYNSFYSGKMATGTILQTQERDLKAAEKELEDMSNPSLKAIFNYVCEIKNSGRVKIKP